MLSLSLLSILMKNVFIIYIPTNNLEALVHYEDTIKNKVNQDRIFPYIQPELKYELIGIFGKRPIAIWGSKDSPSNRSKFNRMKAGDDVMVVVGDTIKLLAIVAAKDINASLSRELWKNLKGGSTEGWNLLYFLANAVEINLPFSEFNRLFCYSPMYQLRGFTSISTDRLENFYAKYDDLYSVLLKIRNGESVEEKITYFKENQQTYGTDRIIDVNDRADISDHIKMQWKLIRLGQKAGSKIWIPKNDQTRIAKEYHFTDFEEKFTAGLDTPANYVENIDVVWKEEFRIDAAFEIENTTSIYSGLLRFSDLKIVAPNSIYPLFIVAPTERRNRVVEQVNRPTFKKLGFERKVRYLSYEVLNEIDEFFEHSSAGLNIDLLVGKSEQVQ